MTAVLEARGLSRRFGGLTAVADVSLDLDRGCPHAVIGPNGAGKSTLINLLSGVLRADAGTIHLNGIDIAAEPEWRRARAGIGRSFQRTQVFPGLTVAENARLAASGSVGGRGFLTGADRAFGAFPSGTVDSRAVQLGRAALDQVGLGAYADHDPAAMSHGQLRLLEIALALAAQPAVLLLDEPLAGLGPEETGPVVALLRRLAVNHALLLVEHDMDVVFALADVVTVMVDGRVLESGSPDMIRGSASVRDAYLGQRT